jgi:pimeloyl-ACP methyl ester carboxylesterase
MTELWRGYATCRYGQLHYWRAEPRNEAATVAPTLVLLHQNPSSSMEYEGLMRDLARDRRVVAFDTPGYGMSDPPPAPLSMTDYAAAFVDAADAMELGRSQPLDVFGFHTGALLAFELALAIPERVGRLVVSGVPMRPEAERARLLAAARATPAPTEDGAEVLERSAALWRYVVTDRVPGVPLDRAVALYAEKNRTLDRAWWAYDGVWSYDYARLPYVLHQTLVLQPHDALLQASKAACALLPNGAVRELPQLTRDIFEVGLEPICEALRDFLTPLTLERPEISR